MRDTLGTGLYFAEYEAFRHVLGRLPSGVQGPQPSWLPFHIPESTIPFLCGSLGGLTSWAIIYPLDVAKTKLQQRALSGGHYRSAFEILTRLVRGPDPSNPKPVLSGIARLYRGLGEFFFPAIDRCGHSFTTCTTLKVLVVVGASSRTVSSGPYSIMQGPT